MIQKSYIGKLLLCYTAHETVLEPVEKLSEAISSYRFCIMTPLFGPENIDWYTLVYRYTGILLYTGIH